jgi:uncharacterized protein YndB with AHSA1/START domain
MTFDKSVVVPLDPDATFALITEPERLRRWMAVAARVELRPGGDYRWTVTPGHTAAGTIVDVEPGKRVVFSWGWEDGDPAPGGSTVTVTLTPVDAGTEVRLVHDGLNDEQAAHHAVGWNHFLGRLVDAGRDGDAGPDDWAATPDPLDELVCAEATLAVLQAVLRDLDSSDLTNQTACSEYNVAQLGDHIMGSIKTIGGCAGAQMPAARSGCTAGIPGRRCGSGGAGGLASTGAGGYGRAGSARGARSHASQRPLARILGSRLGFRHSRRPRCSGLRAGVELCAGAGGQDHHS